LCRFGFKRIREKVKSNKQVETLRFSGENYEYLYLDERRITKIVKLLEETENKEQIDLVELKRTKMRSIRQAKIMLFAFNDNLRNLKYLYLNENKLCHHFCP
jgi:Leucine-rich repeat (LRR) protein